MKHDTSHTFFLRASGPFDVANQNRYFGGWPILPSDPGAIVMAFPIERSEHAAAIVIRQSDDGRILGVVRGCPSGLAEQAWLQALAAISLDQDGSGWPAVGERDSVIGRLQARYRYLRPTLFHSPYEAAAAFVIGHRISIKQTRALRARLASELGSAIIIEGERFCAFPTPAQLLAAASLPGINPIKTERLRAIAQAADEGWLDRERLRAMPEDAALAKLQTLPGVGAFFSRAILHRGAGTVDTLAEDEITKFAICRAYGLKSAPDDATMQAITEAWRPYRMWTGVLLHVWARSELELPARRRERRESARSHRRSGRGHATATVTPSRGSTR